MLQFQAFELESSSTCRYDWLAFVGGRTLKLNELFEGSGSDSTIGNFDGSGSGSTANDFDGSMSSSTAIDFDGSVSTSTEDGSGSDDTVGSGSGDIGGSGSSDIEGSGFDYFNDYGTKLCGSKIPYPILSQGNRLRIWFHSDSSVNKKGVRMIATAGNNKFKVVLNYIH